MKCKKTGGRQKGTPNKITVEIKAIAQKHGAEAIAEAVRIMTKSDSDQTRMAAVKEILDRAYGKARRAVTVDPGDTFTEMLKEFMGSIDGQTRGLPINRTTRSDMVGHC